MRRTALALLAVALVACGTSTANEQPQPPGSDTTLPAPTTTTVPAATTSSAPAQSTTTQASASPTTSTPAATSTTAAATAGMVVAPYFYIDEAGHHNRTGPFVLPVAREVPSTVAVARAAIEQLLAGPTEAEQQGVPSMSTAIPSGVRLLGLTINEDIATIDLSSEFEASDDSASVAARAAQVVFTLARFDSVFEVLFHQDGKPVAIQIGDGQLVTRPVGIHDYLDFAAALTIETPIYGGPGGNPLRVTGFGAAFEATFQYALTDDDGLILEEGFAMTTNGTGWGGFDFTIDYDVDRRQVGHLILWVDSAENGEPIDVREYPVILTP